MCLNPNKKVYVTDAPAINKNLCYYYKLAVISNR